MYYLIFKAAFMSLYYNLDLLVLILKLELIKGNIIDIFYIREFLGDKKKNFIKL